MESKVVKQILEWNEDVSNEVKKTLAEHKVCLVNVMGSPGRETYQPVRLQLTSEGWLAEPVFYRSGLISALAAADGFFVLERNREGLSAGEQVLVYLY